MNCFSVQSQINYNQLDSIYVRAYQQADYLKANEVLNKMRKGYYAESDSVQLVNCVIRQADLYRATKQFELGHYELAVLLESSFELTPLQLVEIHSLQGAISYEERDFSSMLVFTEQAIELARQYNYEEELPTLYNLLGRYYVDVDRKLAYRYLTYSIEGYLGLGNYTGAILPQLHYARLKIDDQNYDEAKKALQDIAVVLETNDILVYRQMMVGLSKRMYEFMGDFKSALEYATEADSLHKLMVGNLAKATSYHKKLLTSSVWSELEAENISLKKEIKTLQESAWKYWTLGLVLVIMSGFLVLLWYSKNRSSAKYQLQIDELEEKLDKKGRELASKRHHTITKANTLHELNEFKTKVLGILGHDLRGPVAQLITYQQAKEGGVEFSEEELQQMDKVILAGAQNSLLVLDNLLKWASEGIEFSEEEDTLVNLSFMMNHITNQMRLTSQQKGVKLVIGDVDYEVVTKESLVKLIVRNLLSNAVKFSDSGDEVTVYIEVNASKLKICISDTGKGIPEEVLQSVQSTGVNIKPSAGSMGERGIGLGIQLSIQFAKQINGVIMFEPNTPKGTIASLVLPIS